MNDPVTLRALHMVERGADARQLRTIIQNARKADNQVVARAARLKLHAVLPSEEPGTLEYDVRQAIHAPEDALSEEGGKTTRLARTRQKIGRDGELKTVADLVLGPTSDGFQMLVARDMLDLSFEAVSLRHPGKFSQAVIIAAEARLEKAKAVGIR